MDLATKYDMTELVRKYSGRVYAAALRLTQNPHDAEDVLQETFLTVMRKIDSFEGRSNIYTWIHRIATNIALGKLRKIRRDIMVDLAPEDFEALSMADPIRSFPLGYDHEDSEFLRQALDGAISELPENLRVVFLLRDKEGFNTKETAEMLKITTANTKVRLMRARVQLRNKLAHLFSEGGRNK